MVEHSQDYHPLVNVPKFDVQHALSCKKVGFVSLRHNHIRNITLILLKEVCKVVRVEPQIQLLTGEYLQHSTGAGNEVRIDISARGFWQAGQMAFLEGFSTQTPNNMQT